MKLVKAALKYVLLAALLLCIGRILSLSVPLSDANTPVIYYMEGQGMSLQQLDDMREEEAALDDAMPFASYSRREDQNFINNDLGKTLDCPVLYLYGDSSLVINAQGELFADDTDGCLLSSAAAWQLFGETTVNAGGKVSCQNRDYLVRGVYEDEDPIVVISVPRPKKAKSTDLTDGDDMSGEPVDIGEENEQILFDRILIRPEGNSARRLEHIHAFENRHGFGQNKTDCSVYVRLGKVMEYLVLIFVMVIFIWLTVCRIIELRRKPVRLIIICALSAVIFIAFFRIFDVDPQIPADMIPNRWSDFDFWGEKIGTLVSSIRHMLFSGKNEVELNYFRPLVDMTGFGILGIVLFLVCDMLFRKSSNGNNFISMLILTCVTECAVLFLMIGSGMTIVHREILLYLWPFLLLVRFVYRKNTMSEAKNIDFGK